MKWSQRFALNNGLLGVMCSGERAFGINLNVGVDFGINFFDAIEVSSHQFDGRELSIANQFRHFAGGQKK